MPSRLPSDDLLLEALNRAVTSHFDGGAPLSLVARAANQYSSTAPSEVVTCRLADGREHKLLCKYSIGGSNSFGHRGGVPYEAMVYENVLRPLGASVPRLRGVHRDPSTSATWLFLDYVEGFSRGMSLAGIMLATAWVAAFHRAADQAQLMTPPTRLIRYDTGYYCGWAERTSRLAGPLHSRYPWLNHVCRQFSDKVVPILLSRPTIIHGEYYPHNVLTRRGPQTNPDDWDSAILDIHPVDWESAAIGAGEIDLASLIDGWPKSYARRCSSVYKGFRGPGYPARGFQSRLAAARMYLALRWLGESRRQTQAKASLAYFEALGRHAAELELIEPAALLSA